MVSVYKEKRKHLTQKEQHMFNYLKKILFTLMILGIPYMNSASKAMDGEDHEGFTVRARKVSFVTEDRQDVRSFTKHSTPSQVVSLEDSKISWTSYLSSSVMSAAQRAYDIVDYTTRNPQKASIIGLCLAYQVVAAAADCKCYCNGDMGNSKYVPVRMDYSACVNWCTQTRGLYFAACWQ